MAAENISSRKNLIQRQPIGFGQWLQAADLLVGPLQEIAILGPGHDPGRQALEGVLWKTYRPRNVGAISEIPVETGTPMVLQDRPLQDGRATAYVCQGMICKPPITDPEALDDELGK